MLISTISNQSDLFFYELLFDCVGLVAESKSIDCAIVFVEAIIEWLQIKLIVYKTDSFRNIAFHLRQFILRWKLNAESVDLFVTIFEGTIVCVHLFSYNYFGRLIYINNIEIFIN